MVIDDRLTQLRVSMKNAEKRDSMEILTARTNQCIPEFHFLARRDNLCRTVLTNGRTLHTTGKL